MLMVPAAHRAARPGAPRFGVLRLGEERVPSRDYVFRGKVSVSGERGVGDSRGLVRRQRAGHRKAGHRRVGKRFVKG
jgi:hypothetical protein